MQFGVIVLTTSAGIMDHEEARRKKVGGKVCNCAAPPTAWHMCSAVKPSGAAKEYDRCMKHVSSFEQ